MSLDLGYQSLDVKLTGKSVYVPDNHLARLMYYLSCVAVVLEVDKNNKLLEYQNYYLLTEKEEELVVVFALLFSPKTLKEKFLFLVGDKFVPAGTDNEFFEIKQETIGAHFNQEIMIAGKSVKLKKKMACNDRWLNCFYFKPMYEYINPNRIITSSPEFGAEPVSMTCPYCGSSITTKTEEKFQIIACICCLLNWLIYCCVQICRNKNLCCFNVTHRCPKCGRVVGKYNAC